MPYHCITITCADKETVTTILEDLLRGKEAYPAPAAGGPYAPEESIAFTIIPKQDRVHIFSSDPFFRESCLYKSPNDFLIPLSAALPSSHVCITDMDDDGALQYWIFHNGSCIDQFHSAWKSFEASEQEEIRGNPEHVAAVFPKVPREEWATVLTTVRSGENTLKIFMEKGSLPKESFENTYGDDHTVLRFKLPGDGAERRLYPPRRLFPWILLAAPAAYATLRYEKEPDLVPAAHTPLDGTDLPRINTMLNEKEFIFFGDYTIRLMDEVETFIRLYYRASDGTHAILSRTETPVDVIWQTEMSTHFTDSTKVTTTNADYNPTFSIPYRTIFWKPEIKDTGKLLLFHLEKVKECGSGRIPVQYTDANYLDGVRESITKDYEELCKLGFLRLRDNGTRYGFTLIGAFKMLHSQWKQTRKESNENGQE